MRQRTFAVLATILLLTSFAAWIALPSNPGIRIGFLGLDRPIQIRQGLDLQGGIQVLLEADLPGDAKVDPAAIETARKIIDNRVNGLGVAEPLVQLQGTRRIIVELPGLQDEEQAVRGAAARALGAIGDKRATDPLIAALKDPAYFVCVSAIEALGKIGDPRAKDAVSAFREHRDARVRSATVDALRLIGRAEAAEADQGA